jgi:hypothetical protein
MTEYRVEAVPWDGHDRGARHLERVLNELAGDGWEVVAILPTVAGTSVRALVASASADTTEFAVVLRRTAG